MFLGEPDNIICDEKSMLTLSSASGVGDGIDDATTVTYIEQYFTQGHLGDENVVTYILGRV